MPITDRDFIDRYRRDGFAIVRGAFDAAEIARIATATDQLYAEAKAHGRSFRHGNLLYKVQDGTVPMVQWPSYHQPVMNAVRLDERIARILAPLVPTIPISRMPGRGKAAIGDGKVEQTGWALPEHP